MKNTLKSIGLLLMLQFSFTLHAQRLEDLKLEELLTQLDKVIADKMDYRSRFIAHIDSMKIEALRQPEAERAETFIKVYQAYSNIQTDSSMVYLAKIEALPAYRKDRELRARVCIGQAEVYGVMGLYTSAQHTLRQIDIQQYPDSIRLFYYQVCRKLYGWMADYGEVYDQKVHYRDLTQLCRDSIIAIQQPSINRNIVIADRALTTGDINLAKTVCAGNLPKADELQRAYIYFTMSDIARAEQNTDNEIRYLTMTAINDFKRGVTEYSALPKLAIILSKTGDINRAYEYIVCTMSDAVYCKARLRTIEATTIFPIIEQKYKDNIHERFIYAIAAFVAVAVFLIAMGILLMVARRRNKQLAEMHRQLDLSIAAQREVNETLIKANEQLRQTDQIKGTYIARYLERCRAYIDSMEQSRKHILKMLKNNKQEELLNLLKSDPTLSKEEALFYTDFDEAFLTLFPNFVSNFNALLLPEAQIVTKHEEMLNTELRIFALIRLGITDSNRIAHFLNYSLPTIYSYRSRLRNKSLYSKEDFEKKVMEC